MQLFENTHIELADAELDWRPNWLALHQAERWFDLLLEQTPWQQPFVEVYGRQHLVPRLLAWYADEGIEYRYSGLTHQAQTWTPLLSEIRLEVERQAGQRFNSVLLNYYRDGQDSMGWHSDDEPCLGAQPCVASLSLGGARRLDWRRKGTTAISHRLNLESGSLLVMRGATQHHWQHQVAKTRQPCAPRINLTFRLIRDCS